MRITNLQKDQLKNIISKHELSQDYFEFGGKDEIFQVKFRDDFFTFYIKMYDIDKYQNTISYVNNKNQQVLKQSWDETISQFEHWAIGISKDIKYLPKRNEKLAQIFPHEIHKYSKSCNYSVPLKLRRFFIF